MYSSIQNVQCTGKKKHFCITMSPCFEVWQPTLVLWWAAPSFTDSVNSDSAGFQLPCDPALPTLPSSTFRAELPGPQQPILTQTRTTTPESPFEMLGRRILTWSWWNAGNCLNIKDIAAAQPLKQFSGPHSFRSVLVMGSQSLACAFSIICWK